MKISSGKSLELIEACLIISFKVSKSGGSWSVNSDKIAEICSKDSSWKIPSNALLISGFAIKSGRVPSNGTSFETNIALMISSLSLTLSIISITTSRALGKGVFSENSSSRFSTYRLASNFRARSRSSTARNKSTRPISLKYILTGSSIISTDPISRSHSRVAFALRSSREGGASSSLKTSSSNVFSIPSSTTELSSSSSSSSSSDATTSSLS